MVEKTKVYKATVTTYLGDFVYAVLALNESDAKQDLLTIVQFDTKMPFGMIRVKNVRKSTRKLLKSMSPVKSAPCENGHWAFFKRV